MNTSDGAPDLERLLRTFADPDRLRLLAAIASDALTAAELCAATDLPRERVLLYLHALRQSGLVSADFDGAFERFRLARQPIFDALRFLSESARPALPADLPDFDRRTLNEFLHHGKLVAIPVARKKRDAVLRWLVEKFEPGRAYPEREVNQIIGEIHEDYATLRRGMIDTKLMERENAIYRRVGELAER